MIKILFIVAIFIAIIMICMLIDDSIYGPDESYEPWGGWNSIVKSNADKTKDIKSE